MCRSKYLVTQSSLKQLQACEQRQGAWQEGGFAAAASQQLLRQAALRQPKWKLLQSVEVP